MKTIKRILVMCARSLRLSFVLAAAMVVAAPAADARIVRLEILSTQSPTFGGMSFGAVGTYEKIFARAYGEVDPRETAVTPSLRTSTWRHATRTAW
jgi:uncharacterized membrane protein